MDSIDMSQIQNIERLGDGLLPDLLGYGDIKIFLNASSGVKTFHCITNAKFHFRCINRVKEARQSQMIRTTDPSRNLTLDDKTISISEANLHEI